MLLGAKTNLPSDFFFSIEIEVKTCKYTFGGFIRSFGVVFGFNNLIGERLATYPGIAELFPKFKKSSYNQIKKYSLQNNINKRFKQKYF